MKEPLELTNSEYILNSIFKSCKALISIKDVNIKYVMVSNAFVDFFHLKDANAAIDKSPIEVWDHKIPKSIFETTKQAMEEKVLKKIFVEIKDKYFEIVIHPIINNDIVVGTLTFFHDITREETINNQLQEKITQLKTLLEYSPLLVYMKDKDLNFIEGSKYAKDFIYEGYDRYVDHDVHIDMEKAKELTDAEDNYVLASKETLIKEKMVLDHNSNSHWYKICKAPIKKRNGSINGIVTITRNIDAEKQLETQKELFVATLSHDLKNPLQGQINVLNLLRNGTFGDLNDEQKEIIDTLIESENFMKNMLYTLLDVYKVDSGNLKLNKQYFDVVNLIETCAKEGTVLAKGKNIVIRCNSKLDKKQKLYADESLLRRVIANILANGIEYAFNDTEITIDVTEKYNNIEFSITNHSPEMSAEIKASLFEKYTTEAKKYQKVGVGLGMYLSKKIVEAHEGDIRLDAKGTKNTIIFEIPTNTQEHSKETRVIW